VCNCLDHAHRRLHHIHHIPKEKGQPDQEAGRGQEGGFGSKGAADIENGLRRVREEEVPWFMEGWKLQWKMPQYRINPLHSRKI
jgi:hypothetical protein